jgi:hypothetical protein
LDRTRDGCLYGANFPVHDKLVKEETTFDPGDPGLSHNMRRLRWEELMTQFKGKINVEAAKAFMADHYDMLRIETDSRIRYLSRCIMANMRVLSLED